MICAFSWQSKIKKSSQLICPKSMFVRLYSSLLLSSAWKNIPLLSTQPRWNQFHFFVIATPIYSCNIIVYQIPTILQLHYQSPWSPCRSTNQSDKGSEGGNIMEQDLHLRNIYREILQDLRKESQLKTISDSAFEPVTKPYGKQSSSKCNLCNFSTAASTGMKRHMRKHTEEKPYNCNQCKFSTSLSDTLRAHVLTHGGEKSFKCTLCNYSFSTNNSMKVHLKRHNGKAPHKCDKCSFSALEAKALKIHTMIHSALQWREAT